MRQLHLHSWGLVLFCHAICAPAAWAADTESDKIVTDRPDFVESSDVVGKGRFQVETSVALERNKNDGVRERSFSTPTLLRIGAGERWELRVETDGRQVSRTDDLDSGSHVTERGYADTSLGVKWHLADQADAMPSLGLLAHVDLDSGSAGFRGNGKRPSLRVSAEWDLPDEFALGVMPGLIRDQADDGRHFTAGIFGIVLGKEWTPRWRSFIEVAAPQIARARDGGNIVTFDVGAAYLLTERCQLDTAVSRGLNRNTADWSWTVGLSFKL